MWILSSDRTAFYARSRSRLLALIETLTARAARSEPKMQHGTRVVKQGGAGLHRPREATRTPMSFADGGKGVTLTYAIAPPSISLDGAMTYVATRARFERATLGFPS